jgi:hypothetical protein
MTVIYGMMEWVQFATCSIVFQEVWGMYSMTSSAVYDGLGSQLVRIVVPVRTRVMDSLQAMRRIVRIGLSPSPWSYWRLGTVVLILTAVAVVSILTQTNEFLLATSDMLRVSHEDDDEDLVDTTFAGHPLSNSMHRNKGAITFAIGKLHRPSQPFGIRKGISLHYIWQPIVTWLATHREVPLDMIHGNEARNCWPLRHLQ